MIKDQIIIRSLGLTEYQQSWQEMKDFTDKRTDETIDEFWILEHEPVYTQGQNGKPEHILNANNIPVVPVDRGGQVTYHGPGQLVAYTLVDVKRKKLNVRQLVNALENSVIQLLKSYDIEANARCDAPGVYVNNQKICSIGLRIRRGCSYHGIALNVNMDLAPFLGINPCGYAELSMTQLADLTKIPTPKIPELGLKLIDYLAANLGYTTRLFNPRASDRNYGTIEHKQ